ncbi:MAG TPA: DNA replication/repair protein RecF [Candidatus Kapabacteria bacterium]|nr:DNA replication/repair protein RecF [Candidatus Kapabacteria bacterium]
MRAESIHLRNFRNHSETFVRELAPKINVLIGPNGAGKTSLLEALSLTTLTKSFTTYSDAVLIRRGEQKLEVDSHFVSDLGVPHKVSIAIEAGPPLKKSIVANSERIRSSAQLVGLAPVVVLTPDEKVITGGSPQERRRFLNMVLSQASRAYLEDEIEYRRALKQRNAILANARKDRRPLEYIQPLLAPWTELLLKNGGRIMRRRARFTEEFRPRLLAAYSMLSQSREEPSLTYLPMGLESTNQDFESLLASEAKRVRSEELRRGATLFGPHRDELMLFINPGQEARLYASQGQHKTLLVAMKLAEFQYLLEASSETPMLLLDDVFSELDEGRANQLLELAASGNLGQTFITSTEAARFESIASNVSDCRIFRIKQGVIE